MTLQLNSLVIQDFCGISIFNASTVKLGFEELFGHHKKVPYFKHLTKVPYKVCLTRNQEKMAIFWNQYFYYQKYQLNGPSLIT